MIPPDEDDVRGLDDTLDDTLADGPAPAAVPEHARPWLAEQRVMHGLLRALHTADASAREGRIASILAGIDAHQDAAHRRRWRTVAVAAALLAAFGLWFALPARLPTVEAAMLRATDELAREVDRHFRVEVVVHGRGGGERVRHEFDLVTRPGMRFLVDGTFTFGGLRLGKVRIGCDGEEVWVLPVNGTHRRVGPLAERERLLQGLGDVLDVGYLDVLDLMRKLPADCDLRVAGRERDGSGRRVLRIDAERKRHSPLVRLHSASLLVDEDSGMVVHVEAEARFAGGAARALTIDYLGEVRQHDSDYRRPW